MGFVSRQQDASGLSRALREALDPAMAAHAGETPSSRYADPTGFRVRKAADDIAAWLVAEGESPVPSSVDDLCRIEALQEKAPSRALAPLYRIRSLAPAWLESRGASPSLTARAEKRAEQVFFYGLDCYLRCREDVNRLKLDEMRREMKLLQRHVDNIERERGNA